MLTTVPYIVVKLYSSPLKQDQNEFSTLKTVVTGIFLVKHVDQIWHQVQNPRRHPKVFECYELDGDNFLNSIIIGNETRVAHYTLETKSQSKQWCHTTSPSTNKFKATISTKKSWHQYFGTTNASF